MKGVLFGITAVATTVATQNNFSMGLSVLMFLISIDLIVNNY